jgi:hypothetical protein
MNRNKRFFFFLAFLILFVQQGALLHAMSHVLAERTSQSQFDIGTGGAGHCSQCLAYADASGASLGSAPSIALEHFDAQPLALFADSIAWRTLCAYFSRAPPLV